MMIMPAIFRKMSLLARVMFVAISLKILLIAAFVGIKHFRIVHKHVVINTSYVAYACDCVPKWSVSKIVKGKGLPVELLHKDIYIEFDDDKAEYKLDSTIGPCAICYTETFSGDLKIYPFREYKYVLKVRSYKLKLRKGCCSSLK